MLFHTNTYTETETLTLEDVLTDVVFEKTLVLYNDDFNTFNYVIDCLIEVCEHDPVQAEQCTFLIHYKGKCDVKNGSYDTLNPMRTELSRRGLTAKIE